MYVTEQLPPVKVQAVELKVPEDAGESLNLTVPDSVNVVPGLESVIVTVQVVGAPTGSGNGEQSNDVVLLRIVEVTKVVPELPE